MVYIKHVTSDFKQTVMTSEKHKPRNKTKEILKGDCE